MFIRLFRAQRITKAAPFISRFIVELLEGETSPLHAVKCIARDMIHTWRSFVTRRNFKPQFHVNLREIYGILMNKFCEVFR